ncbi:MAG: integrase arm-type DNA-binding domain-containing protein [Endomicrobium sp.]|jgi:integrase|nr:integrase arm-type DNA-binding domain-containing protein [Endomicrobium sp.]
MPKIIKPLTDTKIRKAKPRDKDYRLFDGNGLYLLVTTKGRKWWRFRYRFNGRDKLMSFGTYPLVSLEEVRRRRDKYRKEIYKGKDPNQTSKLLFYDIAIEWFNKNKHKYTENHAKNILNTISRHIIPNIGNADIKKITNSSIVSILTKLENNNTLGSLKVVMSLLRRIFRYAVSKQYTEINVPANIDITIFKQHTVTNYPIVRGNRLAELLRAIDNYNGNIVVKSALQLFPHLFLRPSNIRFMEWSEIDFKENLYIIPANKMKTKKMHIVPLSKQSVVILKGIYEITKNFTPVFVTPYNNSCMPLSITTLFNAIRSLGFGKDELVLHSFRGIASTLLNENIRVHGIHTDVIEKQLAHSESNKIKGSYNHAEYLEDRVKLMQWWSDYLDKIKG